MNSRYDVGGVGSQAIVTAYSKMTDAPNQYGDGGTKTVSMFSKLMNQGSQFVMEGVKNLVVKKHKLPVTRIVDALMELKSLPDTDDYRYFDPKLLRATDSSSVQRNRSPFQEAIVFVVGGGNYIEYQNLVDYIKVEDGYCSRYEQEMNIEQSRFSAIRFTLFICDCFGEGQRRLKGDPKVFITVCQLKWLIV
ncbi:Sec1 family domain-containing protein 1 [Nymphon striatum]|nr:Sec1 family domain-containing protein 1 [Nymphon striatum]